MTTPLQSSLAAAYRTVEACRRENWPIKHSPYDHLVAAEMDAKRLTHMGNIPGVLLDMGYVKRRQQEFDVAPAIAYQRNRLHVARQTIVAARLAAGELQTSLFLRMGAIDGLRNRPDRLRNTQARLLIAAMDHGWDIHAVPEEKAKMIMEPHTYDVIIADDPQAGDSVYKEFTNLRNGEHEHFSREGIVMAHAAYVYEELGKVAVTTLETRRLFEQQLQ